MSSALLARDQGVLRYSSSSFPDPPGHGVPQAIVDEVSSEPSGQGLLRSSGPPGHGAFRSSWSRCPQLLVKLLSGALDEGVMMNI